MNASIVAAVLFFSRLREQGNVREIAGDADRYAATCNVILHKFSASFGKEELSMSRGARQLNITRGAANVP